MRAVLNGWTGGGACYTVDKGIATVIVDKKWYTSKIHKLLE